MTTIRAPICTATSYDIPGGSEVCVTLNNKDEYVGTLFINPAATGKKNCIQLLHSMHTNTNTFCRDVLTLFNNEIKHVSVTKVYKPQTDKVETCMLTFCVNNKKKLCSLISALNGVVDVGVSLIGQSAGRYGKISWIMLCIQDTLIPIDIVELEKFGEKYAWEELRKPLFENENIVKVIHDCRPVSDYLYNCCRITLKNVFDTQVCDLIIKRRNQILRIGEFKDTKPVLKPLRASTLAECLSQYIPHAVLERELALMVHYKSKELILDDTMLIRPAPSSNARKYAALTVKYLLALKNKMASHMLQKQEILCNAYIQIGIEANMAEAKIQITNPELIPNKLLVLLGTPPPPVLINDADETK